MEVTLDDRRGMVARVRCRPEARDRVERALGGFALAIEIGEGE